jgi:hypothetical protein
MIAMTTRPVAAFLAAVALLYTATAAAGPTIRINPSPVYVHPGDSVQLRADILGPSEYRTKWILQGPILDGVDAGSLTQEGVYTAPAARPPGPVRVVVQVSTGEWNLPVAAASVPVRILPEHMPLPPEAPGLPRERPTPPPPPQAPEPPPVPEPPR